MKIAIVAPEVFPVPPVRGGAVETVIEEVAARLTGHEVSVFGIADAGLPAEEQKGNRVYFRWKRGPLGLILLASWKSPWKQSGSPLYYRPYANWVAAGLRRLKPDVIWVHSRVQFVPVFREAAPNAKIILSLHNESNLQGDKVWTDKAVDACDLITGCSRYLTEQIAEKRPATAAMVVPLPNGVDLSGFAPYWTKAEERKTLRVKHNLPADGPVVLFAGRLVEEKGAHLLIDAFKKAVTDKWGRVQGTGDGGAVLLIVGSTTFSDEQSTPYVEKLKEQAKGWENRIRFVGHVSREEIASYFLMSDILAFPSVWKEPFGMVILEAMSSGLPVVAFDQGGPAEIVQHGVDGILVQPDRGVDGFAEALSSLIKDPSICEKFGHEARRKVEQRFNWDVMAGKLVGYAGAGRPAKVLIAESGSGFGGSARYLNDLLALLDRQKYTPYVLAAEEGPFIKQVKKQGVRVTVKPQWRFKEGVSGLIQVAAVAPGIILWLKKNGFRLVHLNNEMLSHLPLLVAAKLAGCRVVCHLHGWRPLTKTEKLAVRFVDEFITISEAGAIYYREQLPGRKVEAIPNGLRIDGQTGQLDSQRAQKRSAVGLTSGDIAVAIVGRLVPWKGQEVYLQALADLIGRHLPVVGLVVGNDQEPGQPFLAKLKAVAQELKIERRVRFVPWQEDIWPIYAAADLVVHASTQPEPFGLVILEAMAAKRPVIATSAGGVLDVVIHEETGILVQPGDVKALSDAIYKLITSPGFSSGLVNRAHYRVRNDFTMDKNVAQVMAVYEGLLRR